jgi:preprotein translocase subunit YajC
VRQSYKTVVLWIVLILMFVAFYQFFAQHGREPKEFAFSDFIARVEAGEVRDVTVKDTGYTGHFRDGAEFHTVGPIDPMATIFQQLKQKGVKVVYDKPEQNSFWVNVLLQYLPLVFLFLLFFFFMRQLQAGGGKAMSFGKSKAKLMTEHHNKVTFADVAGIDESKDELEEIISFLKDPKRFTRLGGRIRPAPARRCWPAPWPARRGCPSSPSRARISWRCSWGWAPAGCATSSSRARRTPPASSSSTRSTRWAATAAPAWAAATTSASRP